MLYLKGLLKIQEYLKGPEAVLAQWEIFDLDWDITRNDKKKKNKYPSKFLESGQKAFKKVKNSQMKPSNFVSSQ